MKSLHSSALLFAAICCSCSLTFGQENISLDNKILPADLALLIGNWEGSLTYRNYRDNTPYTIKNNLAISTGKNTNELQVSNTYPDEPKANGSYRLRIKKNGTRLNKNQVASRRVLPDGTIEVVLQYKGRDDKQKATIRITYLISENSYQSRKEVQFRDATDWIQRNESSYTRV